MINLRERDRIVPKAACIPIGEAEFPSPFYPGVEYAAPARGPWNIVHVGMLLPESHQIFVCAQGCLRGVVLTAAEMGASGRFSTIAVRENNVTDGDMEELIINGVRDVLSKLKKKPRAVLVFTSCIHHFTGCDLSYVYRKLRESFPDIDFTDCYMTPILRKTKISPDSKMRMQLYSLLRPCDVTADAVNFIGNITETLKDSEIVKLISSAGLEIRDICSCKSYDEYLKMSESRLNISYNPAAKQAGDELSRRLKRKHLYLPLSYDAEEIESSLNTLSNELQVPPMDLSEYKERAEKELKKTAELLSGTEIAIDYTATPRPLGLASLLLDNGFNVSSVYADSFTPEEKEVFFRLKEKHGELKIYATTDPKMPFSAGNNADILAIGQKAAYFTGTRHFVNLLEGGGLYGFAGICRLMELMREAYLEEKDTKSIIQVKGWGCCA